MEEYETEWASIVESADPCDALVEHFSFLTDDPALRSLLEDVFDRLVGVEVADDELVVSFEDEWQFACGPPAVAIGPDVPASYARMAKVHNSMALDYGLGVPLWFPGVDADGGLYPTEFVEYVEGTDFHDELLALGYDAGDVPQALDYFQDELLFCPFEETDDGEMSVYFVPHEHADPLGPMSRELAFSEVFLVVLAEHVLDLALFSKRDGRVDERAIGRADTERQYGGQWNTLVERPDRSAAFVDHLSFLTDDPTIRSVLDEVADRVADATVADDELIVDFEGGCRLVCAPPADAIDDEIPESYARLAAVHNAVRVERGEDDPIRYPGVHEMGGLFASDLLPGAEGSAFDDELREAGLGVEYLCQALSYGPDELFFNPLCETDSGEEALYAIGRDERVPRGPVSRELCFAEVFALALAERVLDRQYVSVANGRVSTDRLDREK